MSTMHFCREILENFPSYPNMELFTMDTNVYLAWCWTVRTLLLKQGKKKIIVQLRIPLSHTFPLSILWNAANAIDQHIFIRRICPLSSIGRWRRDSPLERKLSFLRRRRRRRRSSLSSSSSSSGGDRLKPFQSSPRCRPVKSIKGRKKSRTRRFAHKKVKRIKCDIYSKDQTK